MDKWTAISVIGFMAVVSIPLMMLSFNNPEIEMAKAGLEECPREIGGAHTIWVKDCINYTKMIQTLHGSENK